MIASQRCAVSTSVTSSNALRRTGKLRSVPQPMSATRFTPASLRIGADHLTENADRRCDGAELSTRICERRIIALLAKSPPRLGQNLWRLGYVGDLLHRYIHDLREHVESAMRP